MSTKMDSDKTAKRLEHIRSHVQKGFEIDVLVHNIEKNLGNPRACAMRLSAHAKASAMLAWFDHHDINMMRQWCYVSSKLDQMWYQIEDDTTSPGAKMMQLLMPLLSNNNELIEWFAHYDRAYDMRRIENHKTHDYWAYQAILAIRGEWSLLIDRSKKIINDPPTAATEQKYLIDHEFYLALSLGDVEKMCDVLQHLVSAKMIKARINDEGGYTEDLISTPAVIYAKIACYHGHNVWVDSPFIPKEWLSVEQLKQYDNHYGFL